MSQPRLKSIATQGREMDAGRVDLVLRFDNEHTNIISFYPGMSSADLASELAAAVSRTAVIALQPPATP